MLSMWIPIARAPASRSRPIQSRSTGGSIWTWIGSRGTVLRTASVQRARWRAPRSGPLEVPVVITSWRIPSNAHRRRHDLRELLGLLHPRRLAGVQRLLDRAEAAARLLVGVAHAGLHDRRREDVTTVQPGDLLVRHAVLRAQVIKARPRDRRQVRVDDDAVAGQHPVVERRPRRIRRHRERHRPAVQQPVPVVARPRARMPRHRRRGAQAAHRELRAQAEIECLGPQLRTSRSC